MWSLPWSHYISRDNRVPDLNLESSVDSYPMVFTECNFKHINLNGTLASLSLALSVLTSMGAWCSAVGEALS